MEDSRPVSPCIDQTEKDIEAYYRHAEIGQAAVVRHTQGHMLQYVISEIEGGNRGRRLRAQCRRFLHEAWEELLSPEGSDHACCADR